MITTLLLAIAIQSPTVTGLRVEYLTNPLGIDAPRPRLSWRITSTDRNTVQAAYQVQVTKEVGAQHAAPLLWDSGRITADSSVFVTYAGPALTSRTRYVWRVRIWDAKGRGSPWSQPASWETGLLQPSDWTAAWIGTGPTDTAGGPSPLLRRGFRLSGAVASARVYATSLGLYELYLNGRRVGDQVFAPGWTSYNRRLQYQTYDVTSLLNAGDNAIGAILGDGWYRGQLGFDPHRNVYGKRLALRLQLEIRYRDGRSERIVSDSQWKTNTGPILASDIYGGETYDARQERTGWTNVPYDDRGWSRVALVDAPPGKLIAAESPPVRRVGEIRPVDIRRAPSGETVFDLGQNFSGWARLKVRGSAATVITLRFAEVLDRDGNLYTAEVDTGKRIQKFIRYGDEGCSGTGRKTVGGVLQ